PEVCRKMGISDAAFYNWRKKFGSLEPSEVRRLKQIEEEILHYGSCQSAGVDSARRTRDCVVDQVATSSGHWTPCANRRSWKLDWAGRSFLVPRDARAGLADAARVWLRAGRRIDRARVGSGSDRAVLDPRPSGAAHTVRHQRFQQQAI